MKQIKMEYWIERNGKRFEEGLYNTLRIKWNSIATFYFGVKYFVWKKLTVSRSLRFTVISLILLYYLFGGFCHVHNAEEYKITSFNSKTKTRN